MKRTRITVKEKLTYHHDVIIEQDTSDERLAQILEQVERELRFGDDLDKLVSLMKEHGLKVVKVIENDLGSPAYSEIEIYDIGDENDEF